VKLTSKKKSERISFGKIPKVIETPDLLSVQLDSFKQFLQDDVSPTKRRNKGLEAVLRSSFPITDTRGLYLLEYAEYYLDRPKYSIEECIERGLTFDVALKAKLRLSSKDEADATEWKNTVEQEVYLGKLPYMTERGTFIINGAERVIVTQLHRSPGVVFSETTHPNGKKMFSAKIVPFRGSWIEFQTDINNLMYVYIDQKKKFLASTLLRSIDFSTNEEILNLFNLVEESTLKSTNAEDLIGRKLATDVINTETGEVIESGKDLEAEDVERLQERKVTKLKLIRSEKDMDVDNTIIANTISKDEAKTQDQALEQIYRELRSNEAPDIEAAKNLIEKTFFNQKKYDLGEVGRYRLNKKLGMTTALDYTVLTKEDIVAIIKYLVELQNGKRDVDDVDHLGNRRVRSVGEQLASQFLIGLARMSRTVKEKMNSRESENISPAELVNARTVSSVISSYFGTNQLSQFMDQTNPLAELTNKRRTSALGPGGLTRERAGFEVRDVHYTHYGRLCPIETPEGPNIGLISSFCIYARVNEMGFIETPYRKVEDGRATNKVQFLSAEDEENKIIVPAAERVDDKGRFVRKIVQARKEGDYPTVPPEQVDFMDVAPNQIVSAAASLIPFLEHDDANRALMGSNMQRQAVPLLRAEAPLVGTGFEGKVARDSRACVVAEGIGVVESVSATEIVVRYDKKVDEDETSLLDSEETTKTYHLIKFFRSNQDTCVNQKAVVDEGQRVKKGDILADGYATEGGELALGKNVLVAFMPWRGYNFEDAIVISERVVSEDIYTSIHIQEYELTVRDTKRGEEEFTRDIPNVSDEAVKDLDENGIVRLGAEVKEKDILIGKITPKGETDPTPEEKLLRAIFGEHAGDVKDASLKAPPGMKGTVIKTKLFSRKKKDKNRDIKTDFLRLEKEHKQKKEELQEKFISRMEHYLGGKESIGVRNIKGETEIRKGTELSRKHFEDTRLVDRVDYESGWVESSKTNNIVSRLFDEYKRRMKDLDDELENEKYKLQAGEELQPGIEELAKVYIAQKRKLQVGDKMAGRHGNKGVVGRIVPQEDMPFMADGTPVDIVLNPLGVPSRMNIGQLYETALGWAAEKLGVKFATPIFDGASFAEVQGRLKEAGLPESAKVQLYDGRTGEPFDSEVTVGYIYMLKLSHLVDDKIHARSTGPYSLITQQPLGGKAQFGGQRFGEMEVWALEAYGAANILQEILTVKSDDVTGRSKTYEAIVKGQNLPEANVPESFNVLMRELQGLGLEVRID
jgi:DNA-directed RNA polymerase subunit beta